MSDDYSEEVIKRLVNSKLSNYQISKDTGISDETIANYRKGKSKPRGVNLKALSNYLDNNELQNNGTLFSENNINQRIKELIDSSGKSTNAYAKEIGVSHLTLKECIDGSNNPDFDTIQKIIKGNPMISLDWLISGKGEKIRSDNFKSSLVSNGSGTIGSVVSGNITGNGHNVGIIPADCERALVKSQCEVDYLKKENKNLKELLKQAVTDRERALIMLDKALSK